MREQGDLLIFLLPPITVTFNSSIQGLLAVDLKYSQLLHRGKTVQTADDRAIKSSLHWGP